MTTQQLPKLNQLPVTLPYEGAVSIHLQNGIPIFRASAMVQTRIEELLLLNQKNNLTTEQEQELNSYEEIDDYLSFINRIVRNLYETSY